MHSSVHKPPTKLIRCPKCGGNLVVRSGKNGRFMGCSNFFKFDCRYTMPIPNYILEFIKANGLNVYGWHKTCWHCKDETIIYTYHPHYDLYILGEEIVYGVLLHYALGEIPKLDQYMLSRFADKIKIKYSHTLKQTYAANVCQHCGKIQGNWYLINDPHGTAWEIWEALGQPEDRMLDNYFIENIPYDAIHLTLKDIDDFIWTSIED